MSTFTLAEMESKIYCLKIMQEKTILPAELMKSYRDNLGREIEFLGKSRQLRYIKGLINEYALDKGPMSIAGPVGTGRMTLAKAIHFSGSDWWRPFVDVDLTGFDDETALRVLFGHKEGHLFSAVEVKPGLVDVAANSTLCLRNFDAYSKNVQNVIHKLYRTRQFTPFASNDVCKISCRFIFTVRNLPEELVKIGYIEEEVCKLLNEKVVNLPPLSKRRDDIVPLAEKFIHECCIEFVLPQKSLSKEAERWLKKAPWNGNAMQLKKSIYFSCVNTRDVILYPNHFALAHDGNMDEYQDKQLDELSLQALIEMKLESFLGRLGSFEASHLYEAIMGRVEEPLLKLVMNYVKGNQIKASRILGINRNTLRTKLRKYGIKVVKGDELKSD
jgi:two-component system nitrogen regulation response regulator GlnG